MNPGKQKNDKPSGAQLQLAMSEWLETPLGQRLLEVERGILEQALARRFGYHLLELGCANLNVHHSSPIGHKFSLGPALPGGCHQGVASAEALPLASASVDLVLLHHALDFSESPHQLLREASRILIAGGHMLILGFNPYSSWGLRSLLRRRERLPWSASPLSPVRVSDWLKLLDFRVEQTRFGLYALPFNSPKLIRYAALLPPLASRFNWPLGAFYLVCAKKQVLPLIPVQTAWRKFPTTVGLPVSENVTGRLSTSEHES